LKIRKEFGEGAAKGLGMVRILEDERALNIGAAVEAAGQLEMAGADGSHLLENLLNVFAFHLRPPFDAAL
jgi:hypothetical protein